MINDYHLQIRAAVAALIEADRVLATPPIGLLNIRSVKEQDQFDPELADGPFVSCYLAAQANPSGGSTGRDDWKFPIVVALGSSGVYSGERNGPSPTTFLGAIQDIFHNRRPAGVPSLVTLCEVDPQGAVAIEEKKYEQLGAATTVVMTARLPRRR
jgi:hypothetical protein